MSHGEEVPPPAGACCSCIVLFPLASFAHSCYHLLLAVVAQRSGHSPATMTIGSFWTEVARLGGYLARSHDGPPGWRTIWKGWLFLHTFLEGVHFAFHLRL